MESALYPSRFTAPSSLAMYTRNEDESIRSPLASPISSRRNVRHLSQGNDVLLSGLTRTQANFSPSYSSAGESSHRATDLFNTAGFLLPPLLSVDHGVANLNRASSVSDFDVRSVFTYDTALRPLPPFPVPPQHYHSPSTVDVDTASLQPSLHGRASDNHHLQERERDYSPVSTQLDTSQQTHSSRASQHTNRDRPQSGPQRADRVPFSVPFTCTFQEDDKHARMVLVPPDETEDRKPLFVIDVRPNCFVPTSYVTTIRRCNETLDLVGRFEMGISRGKPTVFMGGNLYPMSDVFYRFRKVPSLLKERWIWARERYKLHWDCRKAEFSDCYDMTAHPEKLVAKLIPATGQPPGSMSRRDPATRLEVYTKSKALLDEIVVSALIAERKRLSPIGGGKMEELFN